MDIYQELKNNLAFIGLPPVAFLGLDLLLATSTTLSFSESFITSLGSVFVTVSGISTNLYIRQRKTIKEQAKHINNLETELSNIKGLVLEIKTDLEYSKLAISRYRDHASTTKKGRELIELIEGGLKEFKDNINLYNL